VAEDFQSKTEAPTQRHREDARRQGQVAYSSELAAGALLLAGVLGLWLGGKELGGGFREATKQNLSQLNVKDFGFDTAQEALTGLFSQGVRLLGPLFALLFAVALGIGLVQVGFHVLPELLSPNWERLSPATGWDRLFSRASIMRGLATALKVGVVAAVAIGMLRGRVVQISTLGENSLTTATSLAWDMALRLALAIAAGLMIVGVVDYGFQRWRLEQSLRMTRQELKDELKREEGDPQLRARIRKMQREMSRRRMMQDVPRASVVITNPTHLAVALHYERGAMPAPRVVAKGAGYVALQIVDLARRHAVPVVERQPIAQALYKAVAVGQNIPGALFVAVAEVLAYVYRLRGTV
jgi:flagellar biosynthetic protein FlhB